MGDDQDKTLVFLDTEPLELAEHGYRLAVGKPMESLYPGQVRIVMQPESPGLRLASLIGNIMGYLIVHVRMKEVIERFAPAEFTEYFRFDLINHKGRVHSGEYWIVNPIGHIDCLDHAASQITYASSDPTKCLSITDFVFAAGRVPRGRHLFRITTDPREYFVDDRLAEAMQSMKFTNVFLDEVEVR